MIGRKGGARFVTQVDRKSRFLLAAKVQNGTAEAVRDTLIRMFSALPVEKLRSITPDRGHEFAKYSEVSDALHDVPFYFADPLFTMAAWNKREYQRFAPAIFSKGDVFW